MRRLIAVLAMALLAGACTRPTADLESPTDPLGNFRLGFVEVAAPNLQQLLVSRDVPAEVLTEAVDRAMETRFGRFAGNKTYHLAISVEGYSAPPPLVPGKSAIVLRVSVFDDAARARLGDEPKLIYVIRVVEYRLNKTLDEVVEGLAEESARQTEVWLREQMLKTGWFGGVDGFVPVVSGHWGIAPFVGAPAGTPEPRLPPSEATESAARDTTATPAGGRESVTARPQSRPASASL